MKALPLFALLLVSVLPAHAAGGEKPVVPLRVLYVGKPGSDRAGDYASFLKTRVSTAAVGDRDALDPSAVRAADVVVLDWSQSDAHRDGKFEFPYPSRGLKSPLGPRDAWTKPTVLIGSAGHLLAACWEIHGGSG